MKDDTVYFRHVLECTRRIAAFRKFRGYAGGIASLRSQ